MMGGFLLAIDHTYIPITDIYLNQPRLDGACLWMKACIQYQVMMMMAAGGPLLLQQYDVSCYKLEANVQRNTRIGNGEWLVCKHC